MADLNLGEALALRGNDNGIMEGGWFWIVILFLFAFMNNGFGLGGNNVVPTMDDEFIKRDIFNTNQTIAATAAQTQRDVLENRYTNEMAIANLGSQTQLGICGTQKEILQNRYDNALQTQTLSSELATCCCNMRAESAANTQKILDKLCENEISKLRSDLQSAQFQISQLAQTNNLTSTLRPFPQPAYITSSPYASYNMNSCLY